LWNLPRDDLDLIWYQVNVDHIWDYIHPVLVAIHRTVNNVELPYTEEEVQKHVSDWAGYMDKKYAGLDVFPGVVGAVDGFVIERTRPTQRELVRIWLPFTWINLTLVVLRWFLNLVLRAATSLP